VSNAVPFGITKGAKMKHNLTPEQIVYVCFGLLMLVSGLYSYIQKVKENYYRKGYAHGWNRAKGVFSKGYSK
jgi:hypothetical protein